MQILRTSSSLFAFLFAVGCGGGSGDSTDDATEGGASSSSSGGATSPTTSPATDPGTDSGPADSSDSGPPATTTGPSDDTTGGGSDTGPQPVDPCTATPQTFCENFDDYAETDLADGQLFGPWRAAINDPDAATMNLDGTHTTSGDKALHVRLEGGPESGGRLFSEGDIPLLAETPTHLYGRMMMYIAENGTSVHWTFFGVQGDAEPASPSAGNYASYIMSSLPSNGVNTYAFVDGLATDGGYQDCSTRGRTEMPTGAWTCIAFEMDGLTRSLRMYKDDDPTAIVSVDDHGNACVAPFPSDSTWWGPLVDRFFVGTWSFHPMNAPLEMWIDDLVVDTVPVPCP